MMSAIVVGMTTAPRKVSTVFRSLASLRRAGWTDVRLFAEPGCEIEQHTGAVTVRDSLLGAFPNWLLGLSELVLRHPHAGAYLMVQDDALFYSGTCNYLQRCRWPECDGVFSLYCPGHYADANATGFRIVNGGWNTWGALAYILLNDTAGRLLCDPLVVNHRKSGPSQGLRNIDSVVGSWCQRAGVPYYVHSPSLVQHIGVTSTIWPSCNLSKRRHAADFVGESGEHADDRFVVDAGSDRGVPDAEVVYNFTRRAP